MNEHPDSATSTESVGAGSSLTPSSQAFDVVAGALHRVAASLEDINTRQAEAARLIRIGRLDDAFPQMSGCVATWQDVQVSLAAAAGAIGQPVERLAALVLTQSSETDANPLGDLARALNAIKHAVQSKDWVGLADALEYDLCELAQRWRAALVQPDEAEGAASTDVSDMTRSAPAA